MPTNTRRLRRLFHLGQSLVEVVVAVGVVLLLVTGLVVGTITSLRAGSFNRNKSLANQYAQEGLELVRSDRDAGWQSFVTNRGNRSFCLTKANVFRVTPPATCDPTTEQIGGIFDRIITFTWDPTWSTNLGRMTVSVIVSWTDGNGTHNTPITTYLTQWR